MTKKEEALFQSRLARHMDELRWLYMELYGNDAMFAELCDNLHRFAEERSAALKKRDKVQLVGFGGFEVKARAARTGRNPKTKEPISIPASKVPVFKAGKALKDAVAK